MLPPRSRPIDPVALLLVHSAVQRLGAIAPAVQGLGKLVHLVPGAAEDDRCRRRLQVEHTSESGGLVSARHDVGTLLHQQAVGRRRRLAAELGSHRVAQVAAHHAVDARRHCRREQRGLPILRGVAEDRLDVLGEAHVEHLVRFVEDDDLKAAQVQRSPGDVIECAPGRRHHYVGATIKRSQLPADWLAAIDWQDTRANVMPVAMDRLGDLHRELARRHEHQGERRCPPVYPPAVGEEPLEYGKREGGRLPRPSRGLPDQITARQQWRDGGPLYWCRLLITEAGQRAAQFRGQRQAGKAARVPAGIPDHERPPRSTDTFDFPRTGFRPWLRYDGTVRPGGSSTTQPSISE